MNLTRLALVALAGAALTMGVVACGDDDDDGDTNGGGPTQEATRTPAAATSPGSAGNDITPPPNAGNEVDVTAENFAFDPAEITVPAGEPVTFNFTNADSVPHTFTLYTDEEFESPIGGGSANGETPEITVTFVAAGKYYFRCEIHSSQMQGELTAE